MASIQHLKTKTITCGLLWAVGSLLLAACLSYRPLEEFESKTWDWRIRAVASDTRPDPKIKIIMIDQTSLDYFAREDKIYWPWPRSVYNPILYYLKKAGARAVAFDMLFTERLNPEDDAQFAEAVASTLPVVSALALRGSGIEGDPGLKGVLRDQQRSRRPFEKQYLEGLDLPAFQYAAVPMEELLTRSAAIGNVSAQPDDDKVFRHAVPGMFWGDIPFLNLPFALFHLVNPESSVPHNLKSRVDDSGRYIVRFHGEAGTYPSYSAYAIIRSWLRISEGDPPAVPLEEFRDAYVFIGTNAPALLDFRPVPLPGIYPGVELNATVLDNILHEDFMRQVPWSLALLGGSLIVGIAAFVSMFVVRMQVPLLAALYAVWVLFCFTAAHHGWWLPMVYPIASMLLVTVAALIFQYQFEGRQHRFIKNAFQYYVTPEVIEKIVADPARLSLGGERRELTIFFSDIAGFTTLSEKMEPAKLVQFLNKFLSEMTEIVLKSGGTIDKYEGDAIIAFWNAPLSVEDHQRRGVQVALECQRKLHELTDTFQRDFGVEVRMRVGLNTGLVTVGNFGSSTRFNYTMIGDAANLASRLEGANKVFGTRVLVSQATKEGAGDGLVWRKLGDIVVVGKAKVVTVYEPLDPVLQGDKVRQLPVYEQALAAFEAGELERAEELFRQLDGDPTGAAYLARIARERESGFTGSVWNLKEK